MKSWLTFTVVAVALGAASVTHAQQADASVVDEGPDRSSPVDERVEASEASSPWSSSTTESSLARQAKAVFAALRERDAAERAASDRALVTRVAVASDDQTTTDGDCQLMERPGSRIREERCYYPSEVERALDEYQFQEEVRFNRDLWAREQMERTQQMLEAQSILSGNGRP